MRTVALPARLVRRDTPYTSLPSALIPLDVAREQKWEVEPTRALVGYDAEATPDEVGSALAAADRFGAAAHVEEGPRQTPRKLALLIVAGVAAFVTLVGVAISVALSAAEGRADLATLAAVGAPPRRRRALAAAQALLVAGVGCALGVAFGTFVAYAARTTTGSPDFVIPWLNLAITAIVVPLLAVLVAALFTPSRLPLVRRVRRRQRALDAAAAGLADLDLPDRRLRLDAVDQGARARESLAAVRRRGSDDHRRLGQRDGAGAVLDRHRAQPVAPGLLGGDRLELGDGHLGVGLVVELGDLAGDALEQHDGAARGSRTSAARAGRSSGSSVTRTWMPAPPLTGGTSAISSPALTGESATAYSRLTATTHSRGRSSPTGVEAIAASTSATRAPSGSSTSRRSVPARSRRPANRRTETIVRRS